MTDVPAETGTDVVRAALAARAKGLTNLAIMARELQTTTASLHSFIAGKPLPAATMAGLVKILFHGHAEFDPVLNVLRPVMRQPPLPLGVKPDPVTGRMAVPLYATPTPGITTPAAYKKPDKEATVLGKTPSPPAKKRAGWLGGW